MKKIYEKLFNPKLLNLSVTEKKILQKAPKLSTIHQKCLEIQEEEIRMNMNLPYVKGSSEKLPRILRSHKIRSTFYTEMFLRKLLCKPKD